MSILASKSNHEKPNIPIQPPGSIISRLERDAEDTTTIIITLRPQDEKHLYDPQKIGKERVLISLRYVPIARLGQFGIHVLKQLTTGGKLVFGKPHPEGYLLAAIADDMKCKTCTTKHTIKQFKEAYSTVIMDRLNTVRIKRQEDVPTLPLPASPTPSSYVACLPPPTLTRQAAFFNEDDAGDDKDFFNNEEY
ncbi:hypothetical protein BD770DRAFT_428402 [Pilaira anomala]|nr:hypothetical protein BD770DRAFT_428402 [Pilaira anomala]